MKQTLLSFAVLALLLGTTALKAQESVSGQVQAQGETQAEKLKPEQIDALTAPIALYPDDLLSEVLIAATYPLEVVEADRWAKAHKDLKGDALKTEVAKQSWDDSLKALTSTPDVLATMSKNLDWTQKLGDAVLAQQDDVMASVQRLRAKAYGTQKLTSNDQQNVQVTQEGDQQTIIIQPATPGTVYVPYYEPAVVYGAWPYPSYPPAYYPPPPGYGIVTGLAAGIAFGAGVAIANDIWDNDVDWHNGHGNINVNVNNNFADNRHGAVVNNRPGANGGGTQWVHDPAHRHGVSYGNQALSQKFTPQRAAARQNSAQIRNQFRGHPVQSPSGDIGLKNSHMRQSTAGAAANSRPGAGGAGQRAGMNSQARNPQNFDLNNRSNAFSGIGNGHQILQDSNRGRSSFDRSPALSSGSAPHLGGSAGGGGLRGGGGGLHRR